MADRGFRVVANGGSATADGAASRVALCIGVSEYVSAPLKNSAHDAADVADALRAVDMWHQRQAVMSRKEVGTRGRCTGHTKTRFLDRKRAGTIRSARHSSLAKVPYQSIV